MKKPKQVTKTTPLHPDVHTDLTHSGLAARFSIYLGISASTAHTPFLPEVSPRTTTREAKFPSMKPGPVAVEKGRRAAVNVLIAATITNTLPGLLNTRRVFTASAEMVGASEPAPKFQRLQRIQFIAALGEPGASSGTGADTWGLWREDPGPPGVRLGKEYKTKLEATGKAPAGWQFDPNAWWLEEHGLIMPGTDPLPLAKMVRARGRYED